MTEDKATEYTNKALDTGHAAELIFSLPNIYLKKLQNFLPLNKNLTNSPNSTSLLTISDKTYCILLIHSYQHI